MSDDLQDLKRLAGITLPNSSDYGAAISMSATQKAQIMREKNIRPGDAAWFKLWFAQIHLTGEKPI
jgi:hypothetical protein